MTYEEIMTALKSTSGGASMAIAAASAERVLQLLEHMGTAKTAELARRLVDLMWSAAQAGRGIASIEAAQVRSLDESNIDDSHHQLYYPMRALGVVDCAMKAAATASGVWTEEACGSELNLLQDMDFAVGGTESSALTDKLLSEVAADLLQAPQRDALPLMRIRAESFAESLAGFLPAFAKATNNVFSS